MRHSATKRLLERRRCAPTRPAIPGSRSGNLTVNWQVC